MPNLNYNRGRASEYRAIKELEAEGYTAIRSAGSHSCADVVAWNNWCLRLIQIKTFKKYEGDYRKDTECLQNMTLPPSTKCEIWTRRTNQKGWHRQETIATSFEK